MTWEAEKNINVKDAQEILDLISELNEEDKKLVLAAIRGAVVVASNNRKGEKQT